MECGGEQTGVNEGQKISGKDCEGSRMRCESESENFPSHCRWDEEQLEEEELSGCDGGPSP